MSTEHEQRVIEEYAEQLYQELRRQGVPEEEARSQAAAAAEMWSRVLRKVQ
jgi:hypothetical protein